MKVAIFILILINALSSISYSQDSVICFKILPYLSSTCEDTTCKYINSSTELRFSRCTPAFISQDTSLNLCDSTYKIKENESRVIIYEYLKANIDCDFYFYTSNKFTSVQIDTVMNKTIKISSMFETNKVLFEIDSNQIKCINGFIDYLTPNEVWVSNNGAIEDTEFEESYQIILYNKIVIEENFFLDCD